MFSVSNCFFLQRKHGINNSSCAPAYQRQDKRIVQDTRCSQLEVEHCEEYIKGAQLTEYEKRDNSDWKEDHRSVVRQGQEQYEHRRRERGPLHGTHATEPIFGAQPQRKKGG